MAVFRSAVFLLALALAIALPTPDPVIIKWSDGLRYNYHDDGMGRIHLVDHWLKQSDVNAAARFNPDVQNSLHLFTRANPTVSQPMLLGTDQALLSSNYDASRRTAIIIHGWTQSASSDVNTVLVPAFLQAEDMNVFIYDWSVGAGIIGGGLNGPINAVNSGFSLARVIDWICQRTGATPSQFTLAGFSLGAHLAGVAGRNVQSGRIAYIAALDPGANMEDSGHLFGSDAATYTEAIHTNAAIMGHGEPLAHSDFYPNGGELQPGCGVNFLCNHLRSFQLFAETLTTTRGFNARRCQTYAQARLGLCVSLTTVRMGGINPKTGTTGLFHLTTNAESPFSID